MSPYPFLKLFSNHIDAHPHFYTHDISDTDQELLFRTYRGHHPLNTPTNAQNTVTHRQSKIEWHENQERYIIAYLDFSDRTPMLRANREEINSEFPDLLDTLAKNYDKTQFYNFRAARMPERTTKQLHETFGTYYNALQASPEELKRIDGMGDTRVKQFLNPDGNTANKPQWAALTHCPSCNEEFWSTIFEGHKPDENEPTIDTIQKRTYCPSCDHSPIPRSHIMDPIAFTDENILH